MLNELYHTALMHKTHKQDPERNVVDGIYRGNGITVFQHDICKGVHPEFLKCDAVHSELAWRAGYGSFTENTIADGSSYNQYLDGVVKCIRDLGVPAFLICGKSMLARLKPDFVVDTKYKYHGSGDAKYAVYNFPYGSLFPHENEYVVRDFLTKEFGTVLDFSCGYGILAKAALKNGCNAVLSDINTDCVEYVAKTYCGKDVVYAGRKTEEAD